MNLFLIVSFFKTSFLCQGLDDLFRWFAVSHIFSPLPFIACDILQTVLIVFKNGSLNWHSRNSTLNMSRLYAIYHDTNEHLERRWRFCLNVKRDFKSFYPKYWILRQYIDVLSTLILWRQKAEIFSKWQYLVEIGKTHMII